MIKGVYVRGGWMSLLQSSFITCIYYKKTGVLHEQSGLCTRWSDAFITNTLFYYLHLLQRVLSVT